MDKRHDKLLHSAPWFHGKISRDEAELLLRSHKDGVFLIRESTNFPGDYTLCVCFQSKVEHYHVMCNDGKLTLDDEEFFADLQTLIDHYVKDADGICTRLTVSLPKAGSLDNSHKCDKLDLSDRKQFEDAGLIISESELILRERIGKGEFGDVLLGEHRGEKVAVKILKDSSKAAQRFLAEASIMMSLRHPNLVRLLGIVFNEQHLSLVTEYMAQGSLVELLRSRGRLHVTKRDQIHYAYDTCSGMEYLESRRFVHRDLAARNVLVAEDGTAKVSDFGLAREETSCENNTNLQGKIPIKWTAPEALKGKYSSKSDMWSFGILLWEIYSFGRVPYPRIPLDDVERHVEKGYRMEAPEGCPPEIYEIMRVAWEFDPDQRPTFQEVKLRLAHIRASPV